MRTRKRCFLLCVPRWNNLHWTIINVLTSHYWINDRFLSQEEMKSECITPREACQQRDVIIVACALLLLLSHNTGLDFGFTIVDTRKKTMDGQRRHKNFRALDGKFSYPEKCHRMFPKGLPGLRGRLENCFDNQRWLLSTYWDLRTAGWMQSGILFHIRVDVHALAQINAEELKLTTCFYSMAFSLRVSPAGRLKKTSIVAMTGTVWNMFCQE